MLLLLVSNIARVGLSSASPVESRSKKAINENVNRRLKMRRRRRKRKRRKKIKRKVGEWGGGGGIKIMKEKLRK